MEALGRLLRQSGHAMRVARPHGMAERHRAVKITLKMNLSHNERQDLALHATRCTPPSIMSRMCAEHLRRPVRGKAVVAAPRVWRISSTREGVNWAGGKPAEGAAHEGAAHPDLV